MHDNMGPYSGFLVRYGSLDTYLILGTIFRGPEEDFGTQGQDGQGFRV